MEEAISVIPLWFIALLAGVVGTIVGSFLNVVIVRLPERESIVWPGSRCNECGAPIRWYDNLPVISWFVLRGRCRSCKAPFSFRYVAVEALTGGLAAGLVLYFGPGWLALAYFVFIAALVAVTFIDIDHRIIPNSISLPGIVVGLAVMPLVANGDWWPELRSRLIGAAVGGGFLLATALLYELIRKREGMGMGDVKLLAMIGAWLGLKSIFFVVFVSAVLGSILGIMLMFVRREGTQMSLPFGPYLSVAAVVYVFIGPHIVSIFLQGMVR